MGLAPRGGSGESGRSERAGSSVGGSSCVDCARLFSLIAGPIIECIAKTLKMLHLALGSRPIPCGNVCRE